MVTSHRCNGELLRTALLKSIPVVLLVPCGNRCLVNYCLDKVSTWCTKAIIREMIFKRF